MDDLNAITLLYLLNSGTLSKDASLLDVARRFQNTKAELNAALNSDNSDRITQTMESGKFSF